MILVNTNNISYKIYTFFMDEKGKKEFEQKSFSFLKYYLSVFAIGVLLSAFFIFDLIGFPLFYIRQTLYLIYYFAFELAYPENIKKYYTYKIFMWHNHEQYKDIIAYHNNYIRMSIVNKYLTYNGFMILPSYLLVSIVSYGLYFIVSPNNIVMLQIVNILNAIYYLVMFIIFSKVTKFAFLNIDCLLINKFILKVNNFFKLVFKKVNPEIKIEK